MTELNFIDSFSKKIPNFQAAYIIDSYHDSGALQTLSGKRVSVRKISPEILKHDKNLARKTMRAMEANQLAFLTSTPHYSQLLFHKNIAHILKNSKDLEIVNADDNASLMTDFISDQIGTLDEESYEELKKTYKTLIDLILHGEETLSITTEAENEKSTQKHPLKSKTVSSASDKDVQSTKKKNKVSFPFSPKIRSSAKKRSNAKEIREEKERILSDDIKKTEQKREIRNGEIKHSEIKKQGG
jgi:hypothetical protein